MKLAIITCQDLPNGVEDDQGFFNALRNLNIDTDVISWDADVDWSVYDACLLRSVWDYHERVDAFNHWLTGLENITEVINHVDVVRWNQNKKYLSELADFGITIAPTEWLSVEHEFDLATWSQQQNATHFFLKPVIGADSSGTLKFENSKEGLETAQQHLDLWLPQVDMMLQPYLPQVETYGETSAIYFAGSLAHAVRKVPVTGDYRVQDTFGATDTAYQLTAVEMALSKACLNFLEQKFSTVVYARFDFLHDDQGSAYLNEAELIEPSLFFAHGPESADMFAQAIKDHLSSITSESV